MVNATKNFTPISHDCKVNDSTPPPTPTIRQILAGAKLFGPDAQFVPNHVAQSLPATHDPAYIELGNWEPGSKIQLINKSNNPTASFDSPAEVVTLEPTGRDIDARVASVWLTHEQMDQINLDAGDSLLIRVIDADGNASAPVGTRLQGSRYGEPGAVIDGDSLQAASRVTLLDGEIRKALVLRHIADVKAPAVKAFEARLKLETIDNSVTLTGGGLLEEGALVRVMNGRTGETYRAAVDAGQGLAIGLGTGTKDGDTLFVAVNDVNGVAAGKFEVRYGANCKDGRAASKGILAARLPGVIKSG